MNINDYLIDQAGLDWQEILQEWTWILPNEFAVWLATRAGDLFITLPDASIHLLDVGAGKLNRVAANRDDACQKIDESGVADEWLMIPVVDQLVATGHLLGEGYFYSYKTLPVFGGAFGADNRIALPVREHFGAWGSIHRQILDLPDGAKVVTKIVT